MTFANTNSCAVSGCENSWQPTVVLLLRYKCPKVAALNEKAPTTEICRLQNCHYIAQPANVKYVLCIAIVYNMPVLTTNEFTMAADHSMLTDNVVFHR